jgi:four helix bundle protein
MKSHKDLDVWNKGIDLVTMIYNITRRFPKDELYSLTNQIRRAAISIPSNIAEGAARKHSKEFIHFLYISLGSISELETQIIISENLKYSQYSDSLKLQNELTELRKMILGLIRYLENKKGNE